VLVNPDIGACEPGLPDGESLRHGDLDAADITGWVRAAIGHAASNGAVLVLALLGHGFTPGLSQHLYYMGADSTEGETGTAVDVPGLLGEAVNKGGVDGVVGIIDMCDAGGALGSFPDGIGAGAKGGKVGLSLLLAAGIKQPAYGLGMSLRLAEVLRAGLRDKDSHLRASDVEKEIRLSLPKQDLVQVDYAGTHGAGLLWLARNVYHRVPDGASYGIHRLGHALRGIPDAPAIPANLAELPELHLALTQMPQDPLVARAAETVRRIVVARKTARFLRAHMGAALDRKALLRAVIASQAGAVASAVGSLPTEADATEYVALERPLAEGDFRERLARFVVALAGPAGIELGGSELAGWAESIDATKSFNDAVKAWSAHQERNRLRLIVSYYSLTGQWPMEVRGWLLLDGTVIDRWESGQEDCAESHADATLTEVIEWAEGKADRIGVDLECVEIAMSAGMLLGWSPEECAYDPGLLGVRFRILLHWSQRLGRGRETRRVNKLARAAFNQADNRSDGYAIHWLTGAQVSEPARLQSDLSKGKHAPVAGLLDRPEKGSPVLDLLLRFAPITLWPQDASLGPRHVQQVGTWDSTLAEAFVEAHRKRWRDEEAGPLADIRAVWDGVDWLEFCSGESADSRA
jgi:hypothetical protein